MNINNLEKIKVYDRYDGDLVSLLYDPELKEYYLEIAYELWDKYVYYNVELAAVIDFTFNKKPLEDMIKNKECLLFEKDIFVKSLGFYHKDNLLIHEQGWFDYLFEDWSIQDSVAFCLLGYSKIKEEDQEIDGNYRYIDRSGVLYKALDLSDVNFLFKLVHGLSKYNEFTISIDKESYIVSFKNREIKGNSIQNVLYKVLELYFYGVYNEKGEVYAK